MTRLPLSLILLLQSSAGGTTSSAVKKAGAAAGEVGKRTGSRLEKVGSFFNGIYDYFISAEFLANVIVTVIVVVLGVLSYEILARGVPLALSWRRERNRPLDAEDIARIKRQDTAITLGRNALRYVIFLVVALFIVSLFFRSAIATLGGAALLAAVVGFGAQSFLRDIIAGFSIIFEGQYNVGDFIQIHPPQGVGGIVEEFGLRVTKIRALSGEVHYVPNGMIQGVTNYVSGQQRFTVEVQLRDEDAASRVLGALGEASDLYLMPPRLVGREETDVTGYGCE